jgi:two-component system CheB/CheR fusion protein
MPDNFASEPDAHAADGLLADLGASSDLEFRGYKRERPLRRVRDRMARIGVTDLYEYRRLLAADGAEPRPLDEGTPAAPSAFFRDADDWAYLASDVIPGLLGAKRPGEPFRAWCAGCSTGEEAYTLAILLAEAMRLEARERVTILATDVSTTAIARARTGFYTPEQMSKVPAHLQDRYFRLEGRGYRAQPDLRMLVAFNLHDLSRDPPFCNLDLAVCRNTTVSFTKMARVEALARLFRSLRPGGLLFTGPAELPPIESPLFEYLSARHRVFRRAGDRPAPPLLPTRAADLPLD